MAKDMEKEKNMIQMVLYIMKEIIYMEKKMDTEKNIIKMGN